MLEDEAEGMVDEEEDADEPLLFARRPAVNDDGNGGKEKTSASPVPLVRIEEIPLWSNTAISSSPAVRLAPRERGGVAPALPPVVVTVSVRSSSSTSSSVSSSSEGGSSAGPRTRLARKAGALDARYFTSLDNIRVFNK
jgi:hypothetical protein